LLHHGALSMLHLTPRRLIKWAIDLTLLAGAFWLAFMCRFEGAMTEETTRLMLLALPVTLGIKGLCWVLFGVPYLTWRYLSLVELWRIGLALLTASLVLLGLRLNLLGPVCPPIHVPFGVLLIELFLSLLAIVGARLAVRVWFEHWRRGRACKGVAVPTLLIGAGRSSVLLAREIVDRPEAGIWLVGFLDDHITRRGAVIHGLPVLGPVAQLPEVARKYGIRQTLICIEDLSGADVRRVARICQECGILPKAIPGIRELIAEGVNLTQLRDVAIEDLLRRAPVKLDRESISQIIGSRRIAVTGAGGSIGSELCREVCHFGPATLVLVDQSENDIFHIHRLLRTEFPQVHLVPCVADVRNRTRLGAIFAKFCPEVVFHAAAYKHVPLMECNPTEAVKNNILGTRTLADLAHEHGVGEFVMISTDKAVNPTSIMGVSKRVAEIYVQSLSRRSNTRFVTVRFGNVLGSNGSVVPLFKEQIARGGPVTVTHPEMKRYFMTIPEACQLVLQSASMGQGGEIFILDMGEPVKIVDLARDLIRLSGLDPDEDVEIVFTGVRPGEKLFEELSFSEERCQKTNHPQVFSGRLRPSDWEETNRQLDILAEVADSGDNERILALLEQIVPEYRPMAPFRPRGSPRPKEAVGQTPSGQAGSQEDNERPNYVFGIQDQNS
jgi:FlaA1/EpsC-like NDP-sugar epimerase